MATKKVKEVVSKEEIKDTKSTGMSTESKRALSSVKALIRKKHGDDAIVSNINTINYKVIPTGSLKIDAATGIGGFPLRTYY